MKKKKGFTLIELMAVIIILAVIALIVTPLILSSMKDSKEKLYQTQLENIKSAARSYMVNIDLEDNENVNLSVGELKRSGYLKNDIENPKTSEEFKDCVLINVKRKSSSYIYEIDEDSINNCDGSSIDINGDITMLLLGYINDEIEINKTYVDDGIILRDRNNNDIALSNVKVVVTQSINGNSKIVSDDLSNFNNLTSLIDTTKYYQYDIKYSYTDTITSETKELKRTVNVKNVNELINLIKPIARLDTLEWSKNKTATVTFTGEGIYLVKSNIDVITKVAADSCENYNDEELKCIEENHVQANGKLLANLWYKVSSKPELVFEEDAILYFRVSNGISFKDGDPLEINKIDNIAPYFTGNITSKVLTSTQYDTTSIQLTVPAEDDLSGIAKYELYNGTTLLNTNTTGIFTLTNFKSSYLVKIYDNAGNYNEKTITESCNVSNSGTCYNGSKTIIYTCTGTNRTYSATSSDCPTTTTTTASGGSSCGSVSCSSGYYQCGCSCCSSGSGAATTKGTTCVTTTSLSCNQSCLSGCTSSHAGSSCEAIQTQVCCTPASSIVCG